MLRNGETLAANKGSIRDRAEPLGLVHVRVRAKVMGQPFRFIHGYSRGALKGPNRFKCRHGTAVNFLERRDGTVLDKLT